MSFDRSAAVGLSCEITCKTLIIIHLISEVVAKMIIKFWRYFGCLLIFIVKNTLRCIKNLQKILFRLVC